MTDNRSIEIHCSGCGELIHYKEPSIYPGTNERVLVTDPCCYTEDKGEDLAEIYDDLLELKEFVEDELSEETAVAIEEAIHSLTFDEDEEDHLSQEELLSCSKLTKEDLETELNRLRKDSAKTLELIKKISDNLHEFMV